MYNLVLKNVENREMTFKYLGWIYDDELQPQDWDNSGESHLLEPTENGTDLMIRVNAMDEFVDFFNSKYPAAMSEMKRLTELAAFFFFLKF